MSSAPRGEGTLTTGYAKTFLCQKDISGSITGAVLSTWDNIIGPRVLHLWIPGNDIEALSSSSCTESKTLNFIAAQTLCGEINKDPDNPHLDEKFYVNPDKAIALCVITFGAKCSTPNACINSIAIILNYKCLAKFLVWKDICFDWLQRTARVLRVALHKDSKVGCELFKEEFSDFVHTINCLSANSVPHWIPLMDTALHPAHKFNSQFLRKAITAHLYQSQQSVVIGQTVSQVNLMIAMLSLFVTRTFKARCVYVHKDNPPFYSPELSVQGLLIQGDVKELVPSLLQDVYHSKYVTALIDVSHGRVWTLSHPNCYKEKRQRFIADELQRIWSFNSQRVIPKFDKMFERLECAESLVGLYIAQSNLLPLTDHCRESHAKNFMDHLQKTAFSIIQLIEMKTNYGKVSWTTAQMLSLIRKVFHIDFACDLMILLSVAEKLKSGFLDFIFGNSLSL